MFTDRIILVTGAASGLGRATALRFAADGGRIMCADIDAAGCAETAEAVTTRGGEGESFVGDLSQPEVCAAMVNATVERFGGLHHAFNNAGVPGSIADPWDVEGFRHTLAINLEGVAWAMAREIAHMAANGGGTIVNTASIAGLSGSVGTLDYTASKFGVVGLTRAAALRHGPEGVRINAVCPGLIETPMATRPMIGRNDAPERIRRLSPITGQMGAPEDIAEAVYWLSSPLSRFVHGIALPVDGGWSIN